MSSVPGTGISPRWPLRRVAIGALIISASAIACGKGSIGGALAVDEPRGPGKGPGNPEPGPDPSVSRDGGVVVPAVPLVASPVVARRLTQAELDNTLNDLLGDDTQPASRFLSEDEFSPYDNNYQLQLVSTALIDALA